MFFSIFFRVPFFPLFSAPQLPLHRAPVFLSNHYFIDPPDTTPPKKKEREKREKENVRENLSNQTNQIKRKGGEEARRMSWLCASSFLSALLLPRGIENKSKTKVSEREKERTSRALARESFFLKLEKDIFFFHFLNRLHLFVLFFSFVFPLLSLPKTPTNDKGNKTLNQKKAKKSLPPVRLPLPALAREQVLGHKVDNRPVALSLPRLLARGPLRLVGLARRLVGLRGVAQAGV